VAGEFLGERGVRFESLDIGEERARARWLDAGSPPVPALAVGPRVVSLIAPRAQIAAELGLPGDPALDAASLLWDLVSLHEAWTALLKPLSWSVLTMPTPSRGRTPLELAVNVFHGLRRTIEAWPTGRFDWATDDEAREAAEAELLARLRSPDDLARYLAKRSAAWREFAVEVGDGVADLERTVADPLGSRVAFRDILESQRLHAAVHLRQITHALDAAAIPHRSGGALERLHGLRLPEQPF